MCFFVKNSLFFSCLMLFFGICISLKGNVSDAETGNPIEAATVYVSRIQDSTLVDYTISDKNGNFNLRVRKSNKQTRLQINSIIYEPYSVDLWSTSYDRDFGKIKMKLKSNLMDSLVIDLEVPPIRIKNDTLEFNASSFKVRPDATVETLLKELPGVEIDTDGTIRVNGRVVTEVLVNGKSFFDKDGKIAIHNLPADIVEKVQVSDKKTEEQKISGESATSEELSMNLVLDKEKTKGTFGRVMGGYGSEERYETSGLVNSFDNDLRVSVLASSNNINAIGFSQSEIYDNMNSVSESSMGSRGTTIDGIYFGGAKKGIMQSNLVGANYVDTWSKKMETETSYFFSSQSSEEQNKMEGTYFMPNDLFDTSSRSDSKSDDQQHNLKTKFKVKIDSTSTLTITPTLSKSTQKSRSNAEQFSTSPTNNLLNESKNQRIYDTDKLDFENRIYYYKSFKRKGNSLSFYFTNSNSKSDLDNITNSQTIFYQSATPDDIRNQIEQLQTKEDRYDFTTTYKQPINDSLSFDLGFKYSNTKSSEITQTFDYDSISLQYSIANNLRSNSIFSETEALYPNTELYLNKKKFDIRFVVGSYIYDRKNTSDYLSVRTNLDKNYVVPDFSGHFRLKISQSKQFYISYSYRERLPSAKQLLPVENLSNPLNTYIGNPDLKLNKSYSSYIYFNRYDFSKKSGFYFNGNFNYYISDVASNTVYDQNRKRVTTYSNVSDTYHLYFNGFWTKNYQSESQHKFSHTIALTLHNILNKGFINSQLYKANTYSVNFRLTPTYKLKDLLTIAPNYKVDYRYTNYTNHTVSESDNIVHSFGIETTSYYPENFVLGNDFLYTNNSNIASGFKKDVFLWNISLSYEFLNKKMSAKVKVYDLLKQNTSASRMVYSTAITNSEDLILTRYAMFSLSYKFGDFGKNNK